MWDSAQAYEDNNSKCSLGVECNHEDASKDEEGVKDGHVVNFSNGKEDGAKISANDDVEVYENAREMQHDLEDKSDDDKDAADCNVVLPTIAIVQNPPSKLHVVPI